MCPVTATCISNCYICPARLFIIGGGELLSKEGTTQDDLTSMGAYALGILPLLQFLFDFISVNKLNANEVAFADAGKLSSIKDYRSQLTSIGPKYGYFPNINRKSVTEYYCVIWQFKYKYYSRRKKAFGSYCCK